MRKVIIVGKSNYAHNVVRHPRPCGVTRRSVFGYSMHCLLVHASTVCSCEACLLSL
jgi:hypothetical protein